MVRGLLLAISAAAAMGSPPTGRLLSAARSLSSPIDSLFPEERAAVEDPARRKCLWTTGRAGKSTTVLTAFVDDGIKHPNSVYFYFCLTMPHVEEIAWPTLQRIDRDFNLGCRFQEQKLRVLLPGGSWIRLFGFDRPLAMDRFYGIRLRGAAIDEAAFANIDVEEFCEDTLGPRLIDDDGALYLMSIPPRWPRGLFDEIIRGFPKRENMRGVRSPTKPRWSVHSWTALDNPAMRDKVRAEIAKIEAEDPAALHQPWFLRNYRGERVQERGERVYDFNRDRNTYLNAEGESAWAMAPGDHYVLGVDFGYDDATAFSLNVWRKDSPDFVEIESYKATQLRMGDQAARIRMYMDWVGEENLTIVGDYAHKDYFEELRRRHSLPMRIGEKHSKYDWIETYGNDLFLGHVKLVDPDSSPHRKEMDELTWKVMKTGSRVEQPGAPNDCCDAHLMAYREAYHYLHQETPGAPAHGSREWQEAQERELLDELEQQERAQEEW